MKERFKSYTGERKKKKQHALSGDPREPFEHIVRCEHLASTSCFNRESGDVIDLLKSDLVCAAFCFVAQTAFMSTLQNALVL